MSIPTQGEIYSQLMEHIRKAQESAAMMSHLIHAETDNKELASRWIAVSENLKKMQYILTNLAMRKMN
jgi:hypothetical protein